MTCLTQKDIRNIARIIRKFEDEIDFLTIEEVEHLQSSLETEEYVKQIDDFKQHLDDVMPSADAGEEALEDFYGLKWTIEFAGKSVTLDNEAEIYNVVGQLLDDVR